ncbi:hypothetical protein [Methyloceanibacter sp.]|uniref:hypothetical protein n=1 Tax=Methyloceanibacter sp. TaxID=1965321 RepID=UPI002D3B3AE2|nr:hypothetical protein [Methyloceanibacter sp.]HZP07738.1 hypothetical protein [Methyloceanibacter sp.]
MNSRWSFALALCLGVLVFSHADADHHKKKNKDNDAQLEQCTIVKSGGMGCVAPQKLLCQKMKNGKKCCGCVGEKNAKEAPKETPKDTPIKDFCENMDKNGLAPFNTKCRGQFSGQPSCATFSTEGNGDYRCCCYYH